MGAVAYVILGVPAYVPAVVAEIIAMDVVDESVPVIIDPAYCDIKPIMKKSLIAAAACMFFGLLFPTVLICYLANRKKDDTAPVADEEV